MELKYLNEHLIFECIVGSRAYGVHDQDSDYDKSGAMIPGKEYFYGLQRFDQFIFSDIDKTIYDFRKIVKLISDNNPNCLDLLYTPERCILYNTKYWQKIMDNVNLFLSKKCRYTYAGYSFAQLQRIKNHRKYLLNPPKKKPFREDFGLPEHSMFQTVQIKSLIDIESLFEYVEPENKNDFLNELDSIYADNIIPIFHKYFKNDRKTVVLNMLQNTIISQLKTLRSLGNNKYIKEEYAEECEKELKYYGALQEWKQYENWKKNRNPKRAEIEQKYGYDCKHAMHLVRLMKMCKEILETGKVNIDRTNIDAEELKSIKKGIMKYDELIEYAERMDKEFDNLYEKSTLQKCPQIEKINELCVNIISEYFMINNRAYNSIG